LSIFFYAYVIGWFVVCRLTFNYCTAQRILLLNTFKLYICVRVVCLWVFLAMSCIFYVPCLRERRLHISWLYHSNSFQFSCCVHFAFFVIIAKGFLSF